MKKRYPFICLIIVFFSYGCITNYSTDSSYAYAAKDAEDINLSILPPYVFIWSGYKESSYSDFSFELENDINTIFNNHGYNIVQIKENEQIDYDILKNLGLETAKNVDLMDPIINLFSPNFDIFTKDDNLFNELKKIKQYCNADYLIIPVICLDNNLSQGYEFKIGVRCYNTDNGEIVYASTAFKEEEFFYQLTAEQYMNQIIAGELNYIINKYLDIILAKNESGSLFNKIWIE